VQGPITVVGYQGFVIRPASTANHHRQAFELRVAQQFHRRVKRVHVQVRNAP
jgi:hypothetical protein